MDMYIEIDTCELIEEMTDQPEHYARRDIPGHAAYTYVFPVTPVNIIWMKTNYLDVPHTDGLETFIVITE